MTLSAAERERRALIRATAPRTDAERQAAYRARQRAKRDAAAVQVRRINEAIAEKVREAERQELAWQAEQARQAQQAEEAVARKAALAAERAKAARHRTWHRGRQPAPLRPPLGPERAALARCLLAPRTDGGRKEGRPKICARPV